MARIPTVAEVAEQSRDDWERLCRGLAVEIFQAEGIEDRLGHGNGMDMMRVDPEGIQGWQFRRFNDRLGAEQARKIKAALELASARAKSEDKLPLLGFEVWANIDLQPGHMSVMGERERIAEIRNHASSLGIRFDFRGLTWVHTKLLRHPHLAPNLFEDVPTQIRELQRNAATMGNDVRQILNILESTGNNAAIHRLAAQARVHYERGLAQGNQESFRLAFQCMTDAHNLIQGLNIDSALEGLVLVARAGFQSLLGDLQGAERDAEAALAVLPADQQIARAHAIGNGAIATGLRGDLEKAGAGHEKALSIFESLGDEAGILTSLTHIVENEINAGRFMSKKCRVFADRLEKAAAAYEKNLGPSELSLAGQGAFARMVLAYGIETRDRTALNHAAELFGSLHAVTAHLEWNRLAGGALAAKAEALRYQDRFPEALAAYAEVAALSMKSDLPKAAADAKYNWAIVLQEAGSLKDACAKMLEAQNDYSRIGDVDSAKDAMDSIARWKKHGGNR